MTTNSQLSTAEPKKQKQNKLSKQPEQVQNHKYGDHLQGYQLSGERGRLGEMVQGLRSIIGRYKTEQGMLRIVQEMEKPKNISYMHNPWM